MHRRMLRAGFTVKTEIMQVRAELGFFFEIFYWFPPGVSAQHDFKIKNSIRQFHLLTYRYRPALLMHNFPRLQRRAERWIYGGDLAEEEGGCDGYFEAGVKRSAHLRW